MVADENGSILISQQKRDLIYEDSQILSVVLACPWRAMQFLLLGTMIRLAASCSNAMRRQSDPVQQDGYLWDP